MTDSEYYKAVWVNTLQGLLGWSRPRALRWSKRYDSLSEQTSGEMFHETPFYYLVDEIVPIECSQRLARNELRDLEGRIEQMFLARSKDVDVFVDESYDWTTLRDEIDELLLENCGCGMKRKGGSFWRIYAQPKGEHDANSR